jgi:hypothetical protein
LENWEEREFGFVWGYEMKWGSVYRKNFEGWILFYFLIFLIFYFFYFFLIYPGLLDITGKGDGSDEFYSWVFRIGSGFHEYNVSGWVRMGLKQVGSKTVFKKKKNSRTRSRPVGSNGSQVQRIRPQDESGQIAASDLADRIWPAQIIL